ncbi:MAG: cyclic nucleotide-binding domain-containing protein [Myxococcota bacterium]
MAKDRILRWIDALETALADGDRPRALEILGKLSKGDPKDPTWPKRRAEIYRQLGQPEAELAALVQAAELQVEAGQVVRAIATCKRILDLDPDHVETQDRLQLLYEVPTESAVGSGEPGSVESPWIDLAGAGAAASGDAPMDELVLTEVVPEARPAADALSGEAAEIPLEFDPAESASSLDLELEDVVEPAELRPENLPAPHAAPDETQAQHLKGALFRALGDSGARALMSRAEIVDLPADATVFRQGDRADRLFVILEGAVVPVAEEIVGNLSSGLRMGVLESGDFFGEIGLLTDRTRNATVRTLVETRLLAVDRPQVWELTKAHPEALSLLLRTLRVRMVDRLVRTNPLFAVFGRARRGAFARQFRMLEVQDGAVVIRQGLPDQGLYVVLAGSLDVVEEGPRGEKVLATLGHGELCGEFSALCAQPATANVVARGKAWLFALSHGRLMKIARQNPRLHELLREVSRMREFEALRGD